MYQRGGRAAGAGTGPGQELGQWQVLRQTTARRPALQRDLKTARRATLQRNLKTARRATLQRNLKTARRRSRF